MPQIITDAHERELLRRHEERINTGSDLRPLRKVLKELIARCWRTKSAA